MLTASSHETMASGGLSLLCVVDHPFPPPGRRERYRRNPDPVWWRRLLDPYREDVRRRPRWRVAAEDPSESVRSAEIVSLLEREFVIVERRGQGGPLPQP